jgi:hypothetical protein
MWNDNYFRIWARYHVYGIGVLFGWLILETKSKKTIPKFLGKSKIFEIFAVLGSWMICAVCLIIPTFLMSWCFEVDYTNLERVKTFLTEQFICGNQFSKLSISFTRVVVAFLGGFQ